MMNEQDRTLSIDEGVLPLFSSWEVWLSLDLLSCSLLRPSAVSGHLLDVCAPPKHTQGDKRREHKLEMLSSLQIWKCFGAIIISASVQFLKTVCRPKSKLCIDSIHAARVLVGLVCVCTCSAASRLMAKASCSCSSSSPLVWGLACSSSEPALGDVAERQNQTVCQ